MNWHVFAIIAVFLILAPRYLGGSYLVKAGDTLSEIVQTKIPSHQKIYGKGGKINEILKLNPHIKDPQVILAGDTILLTPLTKEANKIVHKKKPKKPQGDTDKKKASYGFKPVRRLDLSYLSSAKKFALYPSQNFQKKKSFQAEAGYGLGISLTTRWSPTFSTFMSAKGVTEKIKANPPNQRAPAVTNLNNAEFSGWYHQGILQFGLGWEMAEHYFFPINENNKSVAEPSNHFLHTLKILAGLKITQTSRWLVESHFFYGRSLSIIGRNLRVEAGGTQFGTSLSTNLLLVNNSYIKAALYYGQIRVDSNFALQVIEEYRPHLGIGIRF